MSENRELSEQEKKIVELQNQVYYYKTITDYTYDWELFIDKKGKLLYSSPSGKRIIGYTSKELISGKYNFEDFVFSDDIAYVKKEYLNALSGIEVPHLEFRMIRKDKSVVHVEIASQSVYDQNNEFEGIRSSIRDISTRKQLEKTLHTTELKFKTIFDILHVGIVIIDEEGRIKECNIAAEKILKMSCAQIHGQKMIARNWKAVRLDGTQIPLEDIPGIKAFMEKKEILDYDMGIVNHLNQTIWLSVSSIPVNIPGIGMISAFYDISDRVKKEKETVTTNHEIKKINKNIKQQIEEYKKLTEVLNFTNKALIESENKLSAIINAVNVGIAILNLSGTYEMCNTTWSKITGYTEKQLKQKTYKQITYREDLAFCTDYVEKVKKGEIKTYRLKKRFLKPDKTPVLVDLTVSGMYDSSGNVTNLIGVIYEMSEN
jgi:PAS domain S-box-containing protein